MREHLRYRYRNDARAFELIDYYLRRVAGHTKEEKERLKSNTEALRG